MAFDFPSAPTNGQVFIPVAGGPSYSWDGTAWVLTSGGVSGGVYIGDTAPPNPVPGQLWWESDSGNTFIYYADGSSSQWVQFNVAETPKTVDFIQKQFITTSGAITLHPDTAFFLVEVQGGGGGGGNVVAGSGNNAQASSGGGAGGYASKWIIRPTSGFAPTCTIGAGGGSAANGTATTYSDGTSSLSGGGGNAGAAGYNATGGCRVGGGGGAGSGGDINATGDQGGSGLSFLVSTTEMVLGGCGASSRFGAGGTAIYIATTTAYHSGGNNAPSRGAGGGGAISAFVGGAVGGGTGGGGQVVITEFR